MEEIEVPIETVQENIHHHAHQSTSKWIMGVALSSAILAAFAAVTALLSGHFANEAMIEQIQASNQWAYFQSKSIKSAVLSSKIELLEAQGVPTLQKDHQKIDEYKKEQEEIAEKAKEKERDSAAYLKKHMIFARSVTLFQIAITIAAIAVLTKKRTFWFIGLGFGAIGVLFLVQALLA